MAINNVAQFAAELNMPSDVLLKQLRDAGVEKRSVNDVLSKEDKDKLLNYLRSVHGAQSGETQDFADSQGNERNQAGRCDRQIQNDSGRSQKKTDVCQTR